MPCFRCGAETRRELCSRCDSGPAPENIVGYRILPRPPVNVYALGRAVKAFASRRWGEQHRFRSGQSLNPDEHELYQVRLRGVRLFDIDRRSGLRGNAVCLVTNQRVMVRDDRGGFVQLRRGDLRGVRIRRVDDPSAGPAYFLALDRAGSDRHDSDGDVSLYCNHRQECADLASAVERMMLDR